MITNVLPPFDGSQFGRLINCHSDVTSNDRHLTKTLDRPTHAALSGFCNLHTKVWDVRKPQVGCCRQAGCSLSRALFRKKCVGPSPGGGRPYFSWKKLATFFARHCRFYSLVHSGVAHCFRHVAMLQKMPLLLWGPLFGGPCSAAHAEHA